VTIHEVTIPYFAGNQNLVFVPALLALLVATLLICLPIVFAPSLRRSKRRTPLLVVAGLVAADERGKLQADLRSQYGVSVTSADANELLNGGKPEKFLPEQAEAAKLQHPEKKNTLKLKPTEPGADTYDLFIGGQPWPS
jgi:hypothetical protein